MEKSIYNRLEEIREKYNGISFLLGDPEFIANRAEFQRIVKEQGELTPIVEKYNQYKELSEKLEEAEELINDASTDDDMKELALEEKASLEKEIEGVEAEIKTLLLSKDPRDNKNIITIEGKGIFSKMKFESGVHRVQRVPATEASGRIHTSTITVAVLAEAEE